MRITPEGLLHLADCYSHYGQNNEALDCYQNIVNTYPDFTLIWHAQNMMAICYLKMMDNKLIEPAEGKAGVRLAYETILSKYPDSPVVRIAQRWLEKDGM